MKKLSQYKKYPQQLVHNADFYIRNLQQAFTRASKLRPYEIETLGESAGYPLLLLTPADPQPGKKNILIAAGFHGEEPAGPWGLCHWLEQAGIEDLNQANISFLPLVNPHGFDNNHRYNHKGENANRGFKGGSDTPPEVAPSIEGKTLLAYFNKLADLSQDGFLTLHEDSEVNGAYIWTYERGQEKPGAFSYALRSVLAKHFPLLDDAAIKHGGYDIQLKDAIGFNVYDNTFESLLSRKGGVPFAATTETPVKGAIEKRVACNAELISAFIAYTTKQKPKI